jgi:hypothetical protein
LSRNSKRNKKIETSFPSPFAIEELPKLNFRKVL